MSDWLLNDWCSTFMLALGHFLWQGTLIAVAMAIVMRAASSSTVRYQWSLSALLLMAVCPIITFFSLTQPPSLAAVGREVPETGNQTLSRNPVAGTPDAAQATDVVNMSLESPTKLPPNIQLIAFVSHAEKSVWERIAPLLTSLYLSGVLLLLLRLAIGLWGGRTLRNQSKPVTESYLLAALQRQAAALGLKLRPALAYCEHVTVPTVMGIFRPMILLPLSLTSGLTPDQLESILAHELAHLRRYDHLMNLLQRVIESLLFFHPAVWWVSNRVREECENCCDDLVVACGAVPFDYAASLLRVAELSRPMTLRTSVAAVSLLATGSEPSSLRHRIARLLGESAAPPLRLNPRFMVFAIIGPLIFVIVALQSNASNTKPASDETSEDKAVGALASDGIDAEVAALLQWIPEADGFQQVDAMLTLAETKDKGGNRDAARTLLALATKMALEMSVDGKQKSQFQQEELQSAALMQICRLTAEYNDASAALELAPKIISPYFRVIALCQIAERQAEANSPVAARKTLEAASAAARQTPEIREDYVATVESRKRQRAMAFESVVESLAKLRHTDPALTVIDEVATSVGTANCYSACLTLLTAEIMADNNEGRDRVLAKIIQLDEAARINPDTPVLGTAEEFLKSAYIAAADQLISIKQFDRAEKLIATVRRNPGDHDSDSWSIDSLIMRLAIQRIKEDSADVQIPTESDFLNRDSFLKFTALYGRELARNGQREKSVELIDQVVAESPQMKSDSGFAVSMIFAAHAFAILGDDKRAMETAEWIGLVPSSYANSSEWDDYGLPFQAMSCQASAMSLIAKAQLERGAADAAIETLKKIIIETTPDGKAKSWYLERVKADAVTDVANWLIHHGRKNNVNGLVDSVETGVMRVTVLSRLEDANATLTGVESTSNSNSPANIQPLTFAEVEQLAKSLGGACHGSKQGTILAATVQISGEKVDDAVIRKLASYPHLEALRLFNNVSVTDDGLSALAECPDLFILELFAPAVTDIGMKSLARMPKLEYLTLSGTKVTDAGLQHLIDAPALTFLSLWSPLISDAGMTHVARMAKLDRFDCYCSQLTDDGLKAVAESSSMTSVSIANGKFSDRGIEFLSKLKGLSFLTVYRAPLTDESLRSLPKCTTLKSLRLSECNITDAGLKHLSSLSMLHGLHLTDGHSVSGVGLSDLKSLPLREITLAGPNVTDETIRQIAQFREIQNLHVGFGNATPDDNQSFGLTDDGLQHLKELKNLTHLTIDGAAITDSGALALHQSNLRYIHCLRCPSLTIDGVKAWRAAAPGIQIMFSDWNAIRNRPK